MEGTQGLQGYALSRSWLSQAYSTLPLNLTCETNVLQYNHLLHGFVLLGPEVSLQPLAEKPGLPPGLCHWLRSPLCPHGA